MRKSMPLHLGQRGTILDAIVVIFIGVIFGVIFSNILPVLIDNFITPQIENRDFGSVSILMYNLILLVYVAMVIISAFIVMQQPPQQGRSLGI